MSLFKNTSSEEKITIVGLFPIVAVSFLLGFLWAVIDDFFDDGERFYWKL